MKKFHTRADSRAHKQGFEVRCGRIVGKFCNAMLIIDRVRIEYCSVLTRAASGRAFLLSVYIFNGQRSFFDKQKLYHSCSCLMATRCPLNNVPDCSYMYSNCFEIHNKLGGHTYVISALILQRHPQPLPANNIATSQPVYMYMYCYNVQHMPV